ncbi:MAG TPA: YdeI/OmpD-associated family protein [Terriglobia bacterium]|nr:YdeI/OmpD-associated family protein [Terriglobia bacterium]
MATQTRSKSFSATLIRSGNKLHWVVIRIPFDVVKIWGVRGQLRVKGNINGFPIRASLFPSGDGRHFMIVNKRMQSNGKVRPGMEAQFKIEPDTEQHIVPAVPELDRVLRQSKPLQRFYQSLSLSTRNEIARHISGAKQEETRRRRSEQLAVRLMETMEAEIELPPVIRQVMARNPLAAKGWERMSRSRRRMHLLGIFYYRNWDSRIRRIEKAVAEMVEHAEQRA